MAQIEIIVSVTWFAFIILMVYVNYMVISTGQKVNHNQNALITCICGASLTLFWKWSIIDMAYIWLTLILVYWLLFDISLNLVRKLPIQYLGKVAITDLFLRKYSFGQPILFKIMCLALLNLVYLLV